MRRKLGKKSRSILELLQNRVLSGEVGLTAREIHETLNDGTVISSTHAALSRLMEDGEIEETDTVDTESGHNASVFAIKSGRALQQNLFFDATAELEAVFGQEPSNQTANFFDDEAIDQIDTLERITKYNSRLESYESKRPSLRKAAEKLVSINPRFLVSSFLADLIKTFEQCKNDLESKGLTLEREKKMRDQLIQIKNIFDAAAQMIGLPRHIVQLKVSAQPGGNVKIDSQLAESEMFEELEAFVETVIFGDFFLNEVDEASVDEQAELISTVTGSDGSTHPLALSGIKRLQSEFEESVPLLFNNAAGVYTHIRKKDGKFIRQFVEDAKYRLLPLSRQDIQRGIPEGILMAPYLFPGIEDSHYAHMLRFVPDNVQWLLDLNILSHNETSTDEVGARPIPNVHVRDGSAVPYQRQFSPYLDNNDYGKQSRKGINRYYDIVQKIVGARGMGELLVFSGAVKDSTLRFFAYLIDWFISRGSHLLCPELKGEPIDSDWELSLVTLSDNKAMANLMSAAREVFPDKKLTSFRVRREFSAIAFPERPMRDDATGNLRPVKNWEKYLREKKEARIEEAKRDHNTEYVEFAHKLDIKPFVKLCEQADVTLFYTSDTAGSPAYTLVRYEFVNTLKTMSQQSRTVEVEKCVNAILAGIKISGGIELEERDFMRDPENKLLIVQPMIMLEAHHAAKLSGRNLSEEITSVIYANIKRFWDLDMRSRLEIRPITFEQYRQIDRRFFDVLSKYSKKVLDPELIERLRNMGVIK